MAVASNVSSIICSWSSRPLTIGNALNRSNSNPAPLFAWECAWAIDWLARRKYLSRLTSGCYGRPNSNGRSIECEFDHLFLVEPLLDHWQRAQPIDLKASAVLRVGMRMGNWLACA
jgi:hypothetical protein